MNKFILVFILMLSFERIIAQQIPVGICGIVYLYDANGARIKRVYFCNNGVDPYPSARFAEEYAKQGARDFKKDNSTVSISKIEEKEAAVFQEIDAILPNPTTGLFSIVVSKTIIGGVCTITDINGRIVQRQIVSGKNLQFNIASLAAGIYFVNILENGKTVTKKIIKQ
jgi:hypothetical protein